MMGNSDGHLSFLTKITRFSLDFVVAHSFVCVLHFSVTVQELTVQVMTDTTECQLFYHHSELQLLHHSYGLWFRFPDRFVLWMTGAFQTATSFEVLCLCNLAVQKQPLATALNKTVLSWVNPSVKGWKQKAREKILRDFHPSAPEYPFKAPESIISAPRTVRHHSEGSIRLLSGSVSASLIYRPEQQKMLGASVS